jgi:hypothetical protein
MSVRYSGGISTSNTLSSNFNCSASSINPVITRLTLFVDGVNNKVGIKTQNPSGELDARIGDIRFGDGTANVSVRLTGPNNWDFFKNNSSDVLSIRRNSVNRWNIDPSGHVTMPAQPSFRAGRSAGAVSSSNIINFSTVFHNIGSHYNNANGRFTAPIAGRYLFMFNGFTDGDVSTQTYLRVNGTNTQYSIYYGGSYGMLLSTTILNLNIGDYVEVLVNVGSVYGGGEPGDLTFSGQLIS